MSVAGLAGFAEGFSGAIERKRDREERAANRSMMDAYMRSGMGQGGGGTGYAGGAAANATGGVGLPTVYNGPITDRPSHAYGRFIAAGLPDHVAAGLVGNLMQESGSQINPAAVGDNGNAYGAGQWNGPRKRAYLAYAAANGRDPTDFDNQIDFLLHEGQTSEKSAWAKIMSTTNAEDAARVASEAFWRPGTPHVENRMGYARAVYQNRPAAAAPVEQVATRSIKPQEPTDWAWFRKYSGAV